MLGVSFCCFLAVVFGMQRMAVCGMSMLRRIIVLLIAVVLRCAAMMFGGVLVVFSRLFVMFCDTRCM